LVTITAHECIVRADRTAFEQGDPQVLPVPLALQDWEPRYPVATYHPDTAEFPAPAAVALTGVTLPPPPPECSTDVDEALALRGLAATWLEESNGRAHAVGVRGSALQAIAA